MAQIEPRRQPETEHDALSEKRLGVEGLHGRIRLAMPCRRHIGRRVRRIPIANAPSRRGSRRAQEPVRPAAEAEVLIPVPVGEVVAGFLSGLGVIRDLVVTEAPNRERLVDREEGVGDRLVLGAREATRARELAELRAGLDGELVRRDMTEAAARERLRLRARVLRRLVR
jgi:hypothetical protein